MDVFAMQQNTNRAKKVNQGTLAQALRRNARYDSTIFTTLFMIYEVKVQKTSTPQRFIWILLSKWQYNMDNTQKLPHPQEKAGSIYRQACPMGRK